MSKKSQLQIKFEAAIEKGLDSESAGERTAALKAAADLLNPNLGELQTQVKQGEDRLDEAKKSLKETQSALDAANAELATLRPQIERGHIAETELAELKSTNDQWKAEQVKLLTADAQAKLFKAEAALRAAEEKLHEADNKVLASGWTELRATLAELISRYSIPMPSFWETSATMPSAFWTLWGWSPTKAKVYTAYKKSFESPTESFKQQVLRILTAGLPTFPIVRRQPDDGDLSQIEYAPQPEITDLGERRECLMEMAARFNCLVEIQRQVEQRQAQIIGQHIAQNARDLQAQQISLSQSGYGRESLSAPEPESSITGCPPGEPHLLGCQCSACAGGIRRRTSIDAIEEIA